jgi:hypothetical protein
MSYEFHTEDYKGCTIRIVADDDPESPREWSNVGTMVCWHRRYTLGDEQPKCDADAYLRQLARESTPFKHPLRGWLDLQETADNRYCSDAARQRIDRIVKLNLDKVLANFIILPLYLYDHSGITISTGRFSCPWDSGQVGFIYCTMEKARTEWNGTDEEIRKQAEDYLKLEVETYDNFLTGTVAGFIAEDPDGEEIDSCWGFYPDRGEYSKRWDYPISEARAAIDHWCEKQDRERDEAAYWAARGVMTAR